MHQSSGYQLNAWPAFADLMLSVVLALVIVLVATAGFGPDFTSIRGSQEEVRDAVIRGLEWNICEVDGADRVYRAKRDADDDCLETDESLEIREYDLRTQITLGASVLFEPEDEDLNADGIRIVESVGNAIVRQLEEKKIREVQIQGHADPDYDGEDDDGGRTYNLGLAADRAKSVFEVLVNNVGFDPVEQLMSISSYGAFSPTGRRPTDLHYTQHDLEKANADDTSKRRNRRIELLLFYPDPQSISE